MNSSTLKIIYNLAFLGLGLAAAVLWASLAPSAGGTGDLWLLRSIGRALAAPEGLPLFEPFAHTAAANAPFRLDGWLTASLVYHLGKGSSAVALDVWRAFCFGLIYVSLTAAAYRRGARPFSSAVFALAALLPLWNTDLAMLSALSLFAAAIYIMEGPFWRSLFSRWFWMAPLLALSANLHASALASAVLAGAWILSEQDRPTEPPPDNPSLTRLLFGTALISCLALNPEGISFFRALALLPWGSTPSSVPPLGQEWLNQFWLLLVLPSIALFMIAANTWVPQGSHRRNRDLASAAALALLFWARPDWLAYGGLWAAPIAASRLDALVDALPSSLKNSRWLLKVPVLFLLFSLLRPLHQAGRQATGFSSVGMPERVVSFLREQNPGARLYHPQEWAGYLLWYLPAKVKVFSDARQGAVYAPGVRTDDQGAQSGGLGGSNDQLELWKEIFNRREIEAALIPVGSALATTMARAGGWQPVAFDNHAVLYVKADEAHAAMIKTWAPRGLRPGDPLDPFDPSRLPQTEADLEVRMARDPGLGILYHFKASYLEAKEDIQGAERSLRLGISKDPAFAGNYIRLAQMLVQRGQEKEAHSILQASLRIRENAQVRHFLMQLE